MICPGIPPGASHELDGNGGAVAARDVDAVLSVGGVWGDQFVEVALGTATRGKPPGNYLNLFLSRKRAFRNPVSHR